MGRDTAGVKGMNVSRGDNRVLAMDVVRPDTELLVVTENGYGKRTAIEEYPVKGRGAMGVKTIGLTERKGGVAGALIVKEHYDLVFISQNGMVQRTPREGDLEAGPAGSGRPPDEPARGRRGECRGAGHGDLGGHRRPGGAETTSPRTSRGPHRWLPQPTSASASISATRERGWSELD